MHILYCGLLCHSAALIDAIPKDKYCYYDTVITVGQCILMMYLINNDLKYLPSNIGHFVKHMSVVNRRQLSCSPVVGVETVQA